MSPTCASRIALLFAALLSHTNCMTSVQRISDPAPSSSASNLDNSSTWIHVVAVGLDGVNQFRPNVTEANVGDIIQFRFHSTNHSVVRGEYAGSEICASDGCDPCVPYEAFHPQDEGNGFDSDDDIVQQRWHRKKEAIFNYTVKDSKPVWIYSVAAGACHKNGMVAVINPAKGTSVEFQSSKAISTAQESAPSEPWASDSDTSAATLVYPSTTKTSRSVSHGKSHNHNIDKGAIIGIAVTGSVVVLLAAVLFWFVRRSYPHEDSQKKKRKKKRTGGVKQQLQRYERETVVVPQTPKLQAVPIVPAIYISWHDIRSSVISCSSAGRGTVSLDTYREAERWSTMTPGTDEKFPAPTSTHPAYAHRSYQGQPSDKDLEAQSWRKSPRRNSMG